MRWTVPKKGWYLPINSQGILDNWFTRISLQSVPLKLGSITPWVSYGQYKFFPGFQLCMLFVWEVKAVCNIALRTHFHYRDELISMTVKWFCSFQDGFLEFSLRHRFDQSRVLGHMPSKVLFPWPSPMHEKGDSCWFIKMVNYISFPYRFSHHHYKV